MRRHPEMAVLFVVFLMSIPLVTIAGAGQSKEVQPGPIPTQISSAKKVFIGYAGESQPVEPDSLFTGGSQRAYDEFYAGMKSAGKYELVGTPADADLLFEVGLTAPKSGAGATDPSVFGKIPYDPQFQLVIRDPKTNALLWAFIEHVQWAILQGNRDKNFELALARLENDVQGLAARAVANADAKP